MNKPIAKLWVGVLALTVAVSSGYKIAEAAAFAPADLTVIQLKMTGSETLVIQNTAAGPVNLQDYLLEYFNKHNPASLSAPAQIQQLPDMALEPRQAILFSSDGALTCGAAAVAELEFTLSDSSGYLAIMKVTPQTDGSIVYKPQDKVNWTSTTAGADIAKVPSATADPKAVWFRKIESGSWQQAQLGTDCSLLEPLIEPADNPTYVQWSTGEEPPATIVSTGGNAVVASNSANAGLSAPVLTELLPNTVSPQVDSEDEFIEIYNSNSKSFDLSDFSLEVGLATKRKYKIASGTVIPAKSFKAFYSSETGLALANNGSQARLLDPEGNVIGQSEAYSGAKDGQSWALANGKWYWSSSPTPASANVIKAPAAKIAPAKKSSAAKSSGTVKGVSTTATSADGKSALAQTSTTPGEVHPLVLAGVAGAALLYGLYEYRNDVANQVHRLRRYREARRGIGKTS